MVSCRHQVRLGTVQCAAKCRSIHMRSAGYSGIDLQIALDNTEFFRETTMSAIEFIDGLRAIAVMAVVCFHAHFTVNDTQLVNGGYLGVDVFFVISGYLIARFILGQLEKARFSLLDFYGRSYSRKSRARLRPPTAVCAWRTASNRRVSTRAFFLCFSANSRRGRARLHRHRNWNRASHLWRSGSRISLARIKAARLDRPDLIFALFVAPAAVCLQQIVFDQRAG